MKSIRTKIVLVSCLICVFSIVAATTISYKILSENVKDQTFDKLNEISKKHGAEIDGWLDTQVRILNEIYDEIIYKGDFDNETLIRYFNHKNKTNPDIKEYYLGSPNNTLVRGFGIWVPGSDYKVVEREWYKSAVESNTTNVSSPYVDINHGELIITLSKSIIVNNEVIGVLCSDISIDHIVNIINESRPLNEGYGFLVDRDGNILAHPNNNFLYSKEKGLTNVHKIYSDDLFIKYIGEKELKTIMDYDGVERFLLYTNLGFTGLDIGLGIPVDEVMKPLDKVVNSSIILALVLTVISVFFTFLLGNSISKPIKVATGYIEKMAELDITEDIDDKYLKMQDEIGRMFNSFQMIMGSLREFLNDLNNISSRVSIFSDELAVLSHKSSIDANNLSEDSINMEELNTKQIKNISELITSLENLYNETIKFTLDDNLIRDKHIVEQLKSTINDMNILTGEFKAAQKISNFNSEQIKKIFLLIEKQMLIMEEIASASQCLSELGDELNTYIERFRV